MSLISRNQACPCGSGRRYKLCCGGLSNSAPNAVRAGPDWHDMMSRALGLQRKDDLAGAEALYRKVLAIKADEPDTLHMLGLICYQTHRNAEALDMICRAIDLTGGRVDGMYGNLGLALSAALAGVRSQHAARLRAGYAAWKLALVARDSRCDPLVTVVLAGAENAGALIVSLDSIYRQSYRPLELIVVTCGDGAEVLPLLRECPFRNRIVAAPGQALRVRLNRGIEAAGGEFVSVLMEGDRYHPSRIGKLVEGVVRIGGEWGFSAIADVRSGATPAAFGTIAEHDTTGYALLDKASLLCSASNLFFSRKLFDAVGGFDSSPAAIEQSFALRAVIQAEPFFIDATLCECAVERAHNDAEGTLRRFYESAVECAEPPNPFAPVLRVWRNQFISRIAFSGHLKYLSRDTLRRFVADGIAAQASPPSIGRQRAPGLDLVSFFSGEFGLAESARGIAESCRIGDIPFALRSVDLRVSLRAADRRMDAWLSDECRHSAIVLMFNPDNLRNVLPQLGKDELRDRYRIGFWYWETEQLPAEWRFALDLVDEIWVATEFVAAAARKFTDKPVTKIRPSINVRLSRNYKRAEFGLADKRFLFLFSFDFGSYSARKNPQGAILAFQHAFLLERQDVGLVIKSHGGSGYPKALKALQDQIRLDPRITLIDRIMSRDDLYGLQSVCDVFVSLHRSEGLGLGLAECMALGKPVIGTAYSGNLEFMSRENSCLVDFRTIPIKPGEYVFDQPGVSWAEPDIASAAGYMARLADEPAYYRRISDAGRREILEKWNPESTACVIRARLGELGLLEQS